MKCPHCNQEHPDGFQFCPATGKKIELLKACTLNPNCSEHGKYILPMDSKFCPTCGWSLEEKKKDKKLNLAVDLGLSVKWAKCNFGPDDYLNPEENRYRCSLFLNSGISGDWGAHWRLPTKGEFEELISKCKLLPYTLNGVKGLKIVGRNGNSIFMPALFIEDNEVDYQWMGLYFSCTKDENDLKNVYTFVFVPKTNELIITPMIRDSVCFARPVYDEKTEYMSDGVGFGEGVTYNILYGPEDE